MFWSSIATCLRAKARTDARGMLCRNSWKSAMRSKAVAFYNLLQHRTRHATNKGRAKVGYCNFPRDCFGVSSGVGRRPFPSLCVRCARHGVCCCRFGGTGWRFAGSRGDAAQLAARKSRTNAILQRRVGARNCDAFAPSTEERGAACGSCSARGDAAR